jgi:hypothetical protein
VIHGTPGISAKFAIALTRQRRVFGGPILYEITGEKDALRVRAHTTIADANGVQQPIEASADMAMAKAEGWTKNPKYQSMPEHMLRWRSAAFLIRTYAPEVLMGMQTSEELEDVSLAGPQVGTTYEQTEETYVDKITNAAESKPATGPAVKPMEIGEQAKEETTQESDVDKWPKQSSEGLVDIDGEWEPLGSTRSINADGRWRKRRNVKPKYGLAQEETKSAAPVWANIPGRILAAKSKDEVDMAIDETRSEDCPEEIKEQSDRAADLRLSQLQEENPFD